MVEWQKRQIIREIDAAKGECSGINNRTNQLINSDAKPIP